MAVTGVPRKSLATLAGLVGFGAVLAVTSGIVLALFGEASLPTALLLGPCAWLAGRAADPIARSVAPDAPRGILAAAAAVSLVFWALGAVALGENQKDVAAGWLGATTLALGGLAAFLQARRRPPQTVGERAEPVHRCGGVIWAIADRPVGGDWIRRVAALDLPEDPNDPVVMRAPTGCVLWRHPERIEAGEEMWSRVETLAHGRLGDSDLCPGADVRRTTRTCAECGQIYLYEEIGAPGHRLRTCIPVAYSDTAAMGRLPVWDLMRFSPRLQWDENPERTYPPAWERPRLTEDGHLDRPTHRRPEGVTEAEIAALPDDRQTRVRLAIAALVRRGRNRRHLTLTPGDRVDDGYGKVEEDSGASAFHTPAPSPTRREDGPSAKTPPGGSAPAATPPAAGEENAYPVRLPEPTHCALWRRPDLVKDGRAIWSEVVELSRDDSPRGDVYRSLVTCRECGQLYFSEDYYRDDDRVFRTYIPVENAERAHALNELNIWHTAEYFPSIHWDDDKAPRWRRADG